MHSLQRCQIGVFFLQIACTYARPCMSKLVSEIKLMFKPCSLQSHDLKWKLYKAVDAKKLTIYSLFVVNMPLGAGLLRLYGLLFTWSHNKINWVLFRLHSTFYFAEVPTNKLGGLVTLYIRNNDEFENACSPWFLKITFIN